MFTKKLRLYLSLLIFMLLGSAAVYSQGKEDKSLPLFKIKLQYMQINNYKNYKTVTIDDSEEFLGHATDNGASLTGYYKADSLKKIVEWVGLSYKVIQNEYYFNNDKVFFVYSTESKYRFNDSTQSFDYEKLDNIFKGRYYFNNNKLINTILSDKEHNLTKQKDAVGFLSSAKEYALLLKKKRK